MDGAVFSRCPLDNSLSGVNHVDGDELISGTRAGFLGGGCGDKIG